MTTFPRAFPRQRGAAGVPSPQDAPAAQTPRPAGNPGSSSLVGPTAGASASAGFSDLERMILAALDALGLPTDAFDLAQITQAPRTDVQAALHALDEQGLVRLHEGSGHYSLRRKGKAVLS